jgi:hypothetical protein
VTVDPYTLEGVVDSYRAWLAKRAPGHLKAFDQRLGSAAEGAQAEAATFSVLQLKLKNPEPGEHPATGGPDFVCRPDGGQPFAVEVTALTSAAVTANSGLDGRRGFGYFRPITTSLMSEAIGKAP